MDEPPGQSRTDPAAVGGGGAAVGFWRWVLAGLGDSVMSVFCKNLDVSECK